MRRARDDEERRKRRRVEPIRQERAPNVPQMETDLWMFLKAVKSASGGMQEAPEYQHQNKTATTHPVQASRCRIASCGGALEPIWAIYSNKRSANPCWSDDSKAERRERFEQNIAPAKLVVVSELDRRFCDAANLKALGFSPPQLSEEQVAFNRYVIETCKRLEIPLIVLHDDGHNDNRLKAVFCAPGYSRDDILHRMVQGIIVREVRPERQNQFDELLRLSVAAASGEEKLEPLAGQVDQKPKATPKDKQLGPLNEDFAFSLSNMPLRTTPADLRSFFSVSASFFLLVCAWKL